MLPARHRRTGAAERASRLGARRRWRAKTREAKLATFHTTDRRDRKNGLPRGGTKTRCACRRRLRARRRAAQTRSRPRLGRIEIVDLWYAKEHATKCRTPLHALLTIVIW